MNWPIVRLYGFILALFALLIGFTSNWAVFQAEELEARAENKRPLLVQQRIARGEIRSADGELLAVSEPRGKGEKRRFVRFYPTAELFGHPVGYDFIDEGRTGLERSENDVLVGEENEFATILEQLSGTTEEGSDLTTTLDAGAQRVAGQQLAGRPGAIVALEPTTGAVRVMASSPGYDPNLIPERLADFNADEQGAPLVNRPTLSTYEPGSTMKIVTAAAAIDSGEFTPETTVDGSNGVEISGVPLNNFGGSDFGQITLTDALTRSVNTAWAQVAEQLGTDTMVDYMEAFGMYVKQEFDYPEDQIRASGPRNSKGKLVTKDFDVGRVAIGQGGAEGAMLATPLQMAQVAATIGNDGVLMQPTFLQEVTDPDGRTTDRLEPSVVRRAISSESAAEVATMMTNVATVGTASGLSLGGIPFAGKTGTAEIDNAGLNRPWFIAFAPVEDPQVAVAAMLESCQGCTGGGEAGPMAIAVMQELLGSAGSEGG